MKRLIAMLLALVLTLSMLPVTALQAFAEETPTLVEITPEETIPEETIPEETIPEETIPEETIPEETIPEETIPEETIPEETVPEETIPEETIPAETTPEETIPEETIPEETLPEETIPEETIPEETVPKKDKATESGSCGENLTWTINDNVLTISGTGPMKEYGYYNYAPWNAYRNTLVQVVIEDGVTSVGSYAFCNLGKVQSVTIPDSVTSIGSSVFSGCSSLTSITIPDGVTSIGSSAFSGCSSLTSITIPDGVTEFPTRLFYECTNLTSVTFGNSVTSIGTEAFYWCSKLSSIVLPEGLVSIGDSAFYKCTGLTSIILPETLTDVGDQVFGDCTGLTSANYPSTWTTIPNVYDGCSGLTSLTIPEGVTTLGYSAFAGCRGLTSITIPKGVTSMGWNVFNSCIGLTSITIPEGVTSISTGAFSNCTGLTSIVIPENVTSIDSSAFSGCTGLTSITIPEGVTKISHGAFDGCTGLTEVVSGAGITMIDDYAFRGCTGLTSITIPEGVTSIGYLAFSGCSGATSIFIPESVTRIGSHAFSKCTGVTSVTISESVTNLGNAAFSGCTGLTEVTIPSSVTELSSYVFDACTNLEKVTVHCNISDYAFQDMKQLKELVIGETVQSIGRSAFQGCTGLEEITFPSSGAITIGRSAFAYCTGLKNLALSEGITTINYRAFQGCTGFEEVIIPASVKSMGQDVFMGCTAVKKLTVNGLIGSRAFENSTSLEEVVFGDTATVVGEYAFNGCKNLTKVTFGKGLKTIQTYAFALCSGLTEVDIPSNRLTTIGQYAFSGCNNVEKVLLPDTVTTIEGGAFYACSALNEVTLPANLTSLGGSAFAECSNLTEIIIPDGVTAINASTFSDCYSLTAVQLPENLQTIGNKAFYSCYLLRDIQIPDTVTTIGTGAFYDCESLLAIDLPEALKTIGSEAFAFCIGLLEVRIPETVTNIGASAFSYCNNLIAMTVPPRVERINANAFAQCAELRHVLFTGTQTQWKEMYIAEGNDFLEDATRHYNAKGDEVTVVWDENGRSGHCTICSADLDLSTLKIQGCIPTMEYEFTYTGSYIRPQIALFSTTYGILTEGEDYTLSFKNNKNVGAAKVTITGMGNFSGSMTQEFYIFPRQVQNVRVTDTTATSITYTFDKVPEADDYGIYQGSDMVGRTSKTTYTLSTKNFDDPYGSIEITIRALTRVGDYYYIGEPSEVVDEKAGFNLTKRGSASLEYSSVAYDGTPKEPSVTVKNSSKKTINSKNYTVAYENNVNIGTATVTIKGIKECAGQKVKTFKIVPQQVTGVEVTELNSNSATITFQSVEGATEYWVYKNEDRVAKITDTTYTFTGLSAGKTYKFSVKANTSIDGENYTGKASETVSAKPFYRLEDCTVTVKYATRAYTGKSVTNTFTIKNPDGKKLEKDEDYKVTYENNKNIGTATATITGKGKYAGTLTATFDIVPPKMGKPKAKVEQGVSGSSLYVTFKDVSQAEWFAIYLNGELYTKTEEFGHYTQHLEPGSYSVTVRAGVTIDGKEYVGAASDSVKVTVRKTVKYCTAHLSEYEFVYTGKSHKPGVTVYGYEGEVLTEGVDYTVSYKNNKNTGKAYVEVKGKGNYNGTLKEYFVINPAQVTGLKVSSTTKTSVKVSFKKASSNSTKYYGVYVDGQHVGRTTGSSYTVKNLELGKKYSVYIIPEKTVSGTTYYGEASETIEVWPGTGIGDYKATLDFTTATYTGEAMYPGVVVKTSSKSSAKVLVEGVDYTVTYENNVGPGKAKVIIRAKAGSAYTGSITKTFKINPPKVTNVTATAVSKSKIEVSFDAAPGATSYWVYVNGSRKAKITGTTCTISGLSKNKTYKITVKSVARVDGTDYTSSATDSVSCKTPSK